MGRVYLAWQFGEEFRRRRKEDYRWSSARAHLQGEDDILVKVEPLLKIIQDWQELLSGDLPEEEYETLCRYERTGRPLGSGDFITSTWRNRPPVC